MATTTNKLLMGACFGALGLATAACGGATSEVKVPAGGSDEVIDDKPAATLSRSTVMLMVLTEQFDGDRTRSKEGSGSGFVVDVGGKRAVATAAHVVDLATEIVAYHPSGTRAQVTGMLGIDHEADVALLEVEGLPGEAVPVPVGDSRPKLADKVVLISSPLGLDTTLSFGTVAAFRPTIKAFQLAAGVSPGSSGGLAATDAGEVLGVIRAKAPTRMGGENIALVTPARYLKKLIDEAEPQPLAAVPDAANMARVIRRSVVTGDSEAFAERSAAGSFDFEAGDNIIEHYCATASDADASVALGEADRDMGDAYWRVSRGRACGSFLPGQSIRVWVGNDNKRKSIHVTVERQK